MCIILVFLLVLLAGNGGTTDCQIRDYGKEQIVCVCNSDYCDTIPRPDPIEPPNLLIYTSNKSGWRFNKRTETFNQTGQVGKNKILVDPTKKFQKILGWGGAFTDATGININSLDIKAQENLLKSYFSEDGIEYSLGRVPIGGTDFSTHGYSYNDGEEDINLDNFQLAPEDFLYKIPYIKQARNLSNGNLQFFASAWTAPKWMKTNGDYSGFGFLKKKMYQSWADYFLKFLDKYQEQGIEFWGITTGNEPSLALTPFSKINAVGWTAEDMAKWILNNLGPTIRNSNHSDIKIMALDDQRFALPWSVDIALADKTARNYVDGIAVHWYFNEYIPPCFLTLTHEHFPEKFILATEACIGYKAWQKKVDLGSWERGVSYSNDVIGDILNWVGGWVDWNLVLNLEGGPTYISNFVDSPIIVNATAGEFYKQPMYYHLGHFSKFVPRDSIRISSSGFRSDVPVVAFQRPDNGTVVVILNKRKKVVPVTLVDYWRGTAQLDLSANSITTLLYW